MNFLIDTDVLSELIKAKPENKVIAWIESVEEERLYLSVLTLGEIEKGIAKLTSSARATKIKAWLNNDLHARFSERLLPITSEVAARWGNLCGQSERKGVKLPVLDSLIAATALEFGLTVVTRNEADLRRCTVDVLNPWN